MADITLQKINKTTGEKWEQADIEKIDGNSHIIQNQVNANTTDIASQATTIAGHTTSINNLTTGIASKVGQSAIDSAISALKGGVSTSGDTLAKLKTLIDNIESVLTSDDTTLDTLQEVVAYIKSEKGLIDSLTSGKINTSDIINDLTSGGNAKVLSAEQGKALKALIDALTLIVNRNTTEIVESTGYGIVSGLNVSAQSTPDMTVNVSNGVFHLSDGTRLVSSGNSSLTIAPSDPVRPRMDIIYLKTDGTIGYTVGNYPSTTAGKTVYTITTNAVANDTVTINGIVFTAMASGSTGNQFDAGADTTATATNLTSALNNNTTINALYTATSNANVITLTEKIAGAGKTPSTASKSGTIVVANSSQTISSVDAPPVPATPVGSVLLSIISVAKNVTSITTPNLIDKRPFKNTTSNLNTSMLNVKKKQGLYANKNILKPYMLESFKNTASFTGLTNCTLAQDTTNFKTGTSSLAITCTTAGTSGYFSETVSWDLSDAINFEFKVFIPDSTKVSNVILSLRNSSGGQFNFTATNLINGFNTYRISKSIFDMIGTISWTDTFTSILFMVTPTAGSTPTVTLEPLYKNIKEPARVIWMFDDTATSHYTVAYPYLNNYGFKGVLNVSKSNLDITGHMTFAQVKELYNYGWDVINHSWSHQDMTSYTYNSAYAEVAKMRDYLYTNGITRGSDLFVYPVQYSDICCQVIKDMGYVASRTTQQAIAFNMDNPLKLPSVSINSPYAFSSFKAVFDRLVQVGGTILVYTHDIMDTPTANNTDTAIFKQCVDYVASQVTSGNCSVMTYTEWCDNLFS